ncbi:MAG: TlyA family RNA methyltransferase [Bacillota bacterium]|nr:TlyA family RNA methyltransferase [Bacillota bacterium]
MAEKERLDILLSKLGLAESREKARAYIISGIVRVNGEKQMKPSLLVSADDRVEVIPVEEKYASRGGLKLEKAFVEFPFKVEGLTGADIGASTGGFTHCLLLHGAKKVYAIDVGYGQLDWKIRKDSRVIVMERTNARYLAPGMFSEKLQFATIDVSFISVKKILPALDSCLEKGAQVVTLIKPQFEAGRGQAKKGVVRDGKIHSEVVKEICTFFAAEGHEIAGLTYSPVKGPKGNIEFLLYTRFLNTRAITVPEALSGKIESLVLEAHSKLF